MAQNEGKERDLTVPEDAILELVVPSAVFVQPRKALLVLGIRIPVGQHRPVFSRQREPVRLDWARRWEIVISREGRRGAEKAETGAAEAAEKTAGHGDGGGGGGCEGGEVGGGEEGGEERLVGEGEERSWLWLWL